VGSGFSYANLAIALPLYTLATGHSASFSADLLALQTCSIALGSLVSGRVLPRIGVWRTLTAGLLLMAVGQCALFVAPPAGGLPVGAAVHGIGMGLFWVATQSMLGSRAGSGASQQAFVAQYSLYVVGSAAGAAATGLSATILHLWGLSHPASIRSTFVLALAAAGVAAELCRRVRGGRTARALPVALPRRGLAVQLPDLLLVAGLAFVLNLAPIVLKSTFRLSALEVGLVVGGVAGAKIVGSFTAGWLAGSTGAPVAVFSMLTLAAPLALALAEVHSAGLFVGLFLATALLATGVWPVLVDAAHVRVAPGERPSVAVAWNVREYLVLAGATAAGGWTFSASRGPALPLVVAAGLLAVAAAASAAVLRRPVYGAA
jgi:MFS family permease